jgi:trimeric autotransporter adhesin
VAMTLRLNTTGAYVALGVQSLRSNTTASDNTAVGYQAGYSNTTGTGVTAVGKGALRLQLIIIQPLDAPQGLQQLLAQITMLGETTQQALQHSLGWTCFKYRSTSTNTTGGGNTLGLEHNTTASNNTAVGYQAAYSNTTGADGDGNPWGYFGGSGSIGVGCFIKTGNSSTSRIIPATDNVGYIGEAVYRWQAIYAVNGTIQTSDGREKNTIVDSNLGLDFVTSLRPVSYKWNVGENVVTYDEEKNPIVTPRVGVRTHYGFIAQEVQAVIPSGVDFGGFVQEPNDGMMSLRYHEFIGPLVKAIQEQQVTITALTARITALEGA